jgi:hypothetical protein
MPATPSEPFMIDARDFVATLRRTDDRAQRVVLFLLEHYFEHGPFQFDASRIAEQMSSTGTLDRLNPEKIAALQPDIEQFFESTADGWIPSGAIMARH